MIVQARTPARHATLALAAIAGLIAAVILAVAPALATDVTPTPISGNATCGELGAYDHEFKIDETPSTGTYSDPDSDFEVDLVVNAGGTVMDFDANLPVDAVFVKGGNEGGNLYAYVPGATSDTGLTTPTGQQISHVSFCFNDVPEESEAPSVEQSVEASVEESVPASQTPEGSVGGGTGTPAASLPDTATGMPAVGGTLATIAFGFILLASLGALAYANVRAVRRRS